MKTKKIISYLPFLLVTVPFALTVKALLLMGRIFHLTYNAVNIIVWYMALPLIWAVILDYKFHQVLFTPVWLLTCVGVICLKHKHFNDFCDNLFKLSQFFIASFGDYYKWSVIICLIVPIVMTILLLIA